MRRLLLNFTEIINSPKQNNPHRHLASYGTTIPYSELWSPSAGEVSSGPSSPGSSSPIPSS